MAKQKIITIEKDEDGVFIGTASSLKGCYSYGETLDELMVNLKEAIEAHREAFGEDDIALPIIRFNLCARKSPTIANGGSHR
jgi:predicted RNase H-like HicB family nuclease